MRVGVVQAIVRPPWSFQNPTKVVRGRRARKRPDEQTTFVQSEAQKKNRTLAGPVSLSARGPTITFQRGTADGATIAIWEDGQPPAASERQYAAAILSHNAKACMPAMRHRLGHSGAAPRCMRASA